MTTIINTNLEPNVISLHGVEKYYVVGKDQQLVIKGIDLVIKKNSGTYVIILCKENKHFTKYLFEKIELTNEELKKVIMS